MITSDELFESAFHHAGIGMALVSTEGQFLKVNRALCRIVGRSEPELLACTFQEITYPEDLHADLAFVRQTLAGQIDTYRMEKRYLHKDGRVVPIVLNVSLVRNPDGSPRFFISQMQDNSATIFAEQTLRASESRYRLITHNSRDLVALHHEDGSFVFLSPSAESILGYKPAELIYSDLFEIVLPEDRAAVREALETAKASGSSSVTYRIRHREGRDVWLESLFRISAYDEANVKLQSNSRDISRRVAAEEKLQQSNRELQESLRLVRELREIIPICAYCKSIRNDQNYWQQIEAYLAHHTDAQLSHGICPQCLERVAKEIEQSGAKG